MGKNGPLETFFDLLGYVAERGEHFPEGDTVGRTADEKLPVHYVSSPIDPNQESMASRAQVSLYRR